MLGLIIIIKVCIFWSSYKCVNDNTESIKRYDPDLDKYIKSKFCRILVIDIQTNAAPNNPIPNQLFVLYKLLQNPPIVRE